MSVRLPALAALLLAAGCVRLPVDEPSLVQPSGVEGPRPDDAFWMVWVHGTERTRCEGPLCSRAYCSIVFDHEVVPASRAFRHANATDVRQPWVVVAFDHFTDGDCPLAYQHAFNATRATARMGEWGDLLLDVHEDGDLRANGHEVPLGTRAVWRYERRGVEGEFTVENLGAWPQAGLSRAGSSAPSAAPP